MNDQRILVFGYSEVGATCLKFLIDRGENIVHVYTHQDNSKETIWFPSMSKLCAENNIPFTLDADLKSETEKIKISQLKPNLIFSFYYRNLIPKYILEMGALGAYNMHGSLLPKYRGRSPVNWAVLKGEKETGATLHVMTEKADAGDIIDQEAIPIGPDDTALQIQNRVTQAAAKVLARQIENLKSGNAPRKAQDPSLSTYFGGRRPEDGEIDWNSSAQEVHNLIRAVTHPFPGATADIQGKKTYIWASHLPLRQATDATPGKLVIENGRLFVICGDRQLIEILRLQTEGSQEMESGEYLKREKI